MLVTVFQKSKSKQLWSYLFKGQNCFMKTFWKKAAMITYYFILLLLLSQL